MAVMWRPCAITLAVALHLEQWTVARAWGAEAHDRIAHIAEVLLTGKKRDEIRSLMHGDLVDYSDWEQRMTAKYPETNVLHWHHQSPEWNCMATLGDDEHLRCDHKQAAEQGSLFCAMAFFFYHFSHEALVREYPQPEEPINEPKNLPSLDKVASFDIGKEHYLRWLAILIGDMHQPLHWLREHNYGKKITVLYKQFPYSLQDFWETELPKMVKERHQIPKAGNSSRSKWERSIKEQYEERHHAWGHKLPPELFRHWAKEAAEAVCSQVYQQMEANHADGTRTIDEPFHLTDELLNRWIKLASDLMNLAGERVAFVFLDILEHRKHKALHHEGRGRQHRHKRHVRNFIMNFMIAIVEIPIIIKLFRWHDRSGFNLAALFGHRKNTA